MADHYLVISIYRVKMIYERVLYSKIIAVKSKYF